jgi:2-polyprenyl-3-methyl-5-hydroxy-6-metoxy-1,4-benzoquinol methylase
VRPAVREELLRINRAFYQSLAQPFAETRPRPQPGVLRVLAGVDRAASVLDVGCGHGLAAEELSRLGHQGSYRGLDSSEALIGLARRRIDAAWANFAVADLTQPEWRGGDGAYDWLLGFAVLHHIPDTALRQRVVSELRSALSTGGRAAVSVWDFTASERLRKRIVPWEEAGLTEEDVDPGDALLDWRHAGHALRYVHRFSSEELARLAHDAGLTVVEDFRSDGQGGRLGL